MAKGEGSNKIPTGGPANLLRNIFDHVPIFAPTSINTFDLGAT